MLIEYFIASSLNQSLFNFVNENPVLKEDKIEEKSKKKKKENLQTLPESRNKYPALALVKAFVLITHIEERSD